ncbi:putative ankyrin repeat protein RF_0381 [Haliotis rubra]|uniref:putative ankyrin repeat protein RF_0381 n=1 Tax=Haliotis rubra TaxID=36100 RepID=UPI001EE63578|nr:putative ankyrin repeat protein RF_0381 [Haliotis rubra]
MKNPVATVKLELLEVIHRLDDRSAALILVLLCDGQLNVGQLETESDPALETHLQAVRTLVPTSTNHSVAKAVRSLCGSLLTEGNITTFSHSVIYDVCVSVLYSTEPEFVRRHFSIQFLMKHVQDQQSDMIIPVNEHQLIIPFSDPYSGTLVDRMVGSLVYDGTLSTYIMHPIWKREEIVKKLHQMIKDTDSLPNHARHNIFCYACFTWNKSIMAKLLPHCDINSRDLNGWTPVWYSVASGHKDSLKYIIGHKDPTKLSGDDKNSFLHVASEYGTASVVEYLLNDLKCDIYSQGADGWTPVTRAVFAGKKDVLNVLLNHKSLPDFIINRALHLACEWGKISMTSLMDISSPGKHGQTPIMSAIASGKKKIFDLLVSRKADINLRDDGNNSLLHLACEPDDTSILQTLLPHIDINIPGQHGWTPVMKAAVNGRKDIYDLLVKEKADLKLTDDDGNNLLHLACHGGNVSIVNHLLPQFDINSRGGSGWTPVMYAVVNGHKVMFNFLVSEGADLSLTDDYNNSVFHLGCLGGNEAIVKALLPKADLNSQGNLGRTGVMKAP